MAEPAPVIILGASGHARVVLDTLRQNPDKYRVVGLTDPDPAKQNALVDGVRVLGDDSVLKDPDWKDHSVIVGVGENLLRARLYNLCLELDLKLVSAVHPGAIVSSGAQLGKGVAIMAGVVLNCGVRLGDNSIVNTGATVDHDCQVGKHVHIAPGVNLAGNVQVEEGVLLGIGSTVIPQTKIGEWAVVGAGSAVIRDVPARTTVGGVPARRLKP